MLFHDRHEAGRRLGARLQGVVGDREDVVVLALPRGGVPVGFEVAIRLGAPLDVFVVRKLGVPRREELAMGAIAADGVCVINDDVVEALGIPPEIVDEVAAAERAELERRELLYRQGRPREPVAGRTALVVDDGLATGATMRAAVLALRRMHPARVLVAVPVAAADTAERIAQLADGFECLALPEPFGAVGAWYRDFSQTTDDEVQRLLARAARRRAAA